MKPISISEVKEMLKKEQKKRELNREQKIALEHAEHFSSFSIKKANELIKELMKLDGMKVENAYKIVDLLPTNEEELKAIFFKERSIPSKEGMEKIIQLIGKYR